MSAPKLSKLFRPSPEVELSKEQEARLKVLQNAGTTPRDERFPSTNQALHCWNRYNEWVLCQQQSDEEKCTPLRGYAESICPSPWTEEWDEQREAGTFSGIGNRIDQEGHKHH
ncbi:hypothetical protein ACA910_021566 [Epithemia clementina (nom. ined.)]